MSCGPKATYYSTRRRLRAHGRRRGPRRGSCRRRQCPSARLDANSSRRCPGRSNSSPREPVGRGSRCKLRAASIGSLWRPWRVPRRRSAFIERPCTPKRYVTWSPADQLRALTTASSLMSCGWFVWLTRLILAPKPPAHRLDDARRVHALWRLRTCHFAL